MVDILLMAVDVVVPMIVAMVELVVAAAAKEPVLVQVQ